jgi:hypothetical protein
MNAAIAENSPIQIGAADPARHDLLYRDSVLDLLQDESWEH